MKRFILILILLGSCNCDEYYKRDKKIIARLKTYKDSYKLISKNYNFLKSKELSFKSRSPGLQGLSIDLEKITKLTKKEDNEILTSIKQLWDNGVIDKSGEIKFNLYNDSPSIDFYVKRCRNIEHIIYFGEDDMYDNRGQSDDFSIFLLDSLDGHWRYVIQQVNAAR